jgi:hypothetical protein
MLIDGKEPLIKNIAAIAVHAKMQKVLSALETDED